MLNFLLDLFGNDVEQTWYSTGEKRDKTVDSVDAADGKTYRKVVRAEKEVNFETGAIRMTPLEGATERLEVDE